MPVFTVSDSTSRRRCDSVAPSQSAARTRGSRPPEIRLLAAVLEEALHDIVKHAGARSRTRRRQFTDACEWFWDEGQDWPFAFENVCAVLELDATAVRQRVRGLVLATGCPFGVGPDTLISPAASEAEEACA